MITGVENNAAKIVVLINTVSILFAQLPSDKQQQALKVLKGLADCDYAKLSNSIDEQRRMEYGKSLSEGYKMIIDSLLLFAPAKR